MVLRCLHQRLLSQDVTIRHHVVYVGASSVLLRRPYIHNMVAYGDSPSRDRAMGVLSSPVQLVCPVSGSSQCVQSVCPFKGSS